MQLTHALQDSDLCPPSFLRRFIAAVIDLVLCYATLLVEAVAVAILQPIPMDVHAAEQRLVANIVAVVVISLPLALILILPVSRGGHTPGQFLCAISVVRADTKGPTGLIRAAGRTLLWPFSFASLGMGFLTALRDPLRRTWHDRLTGTLMLLGPPPELTTTKCERCGYDLRGSLTMGRCPECGSTFDPDTVRRGTEQDEHRGRYC
jgi:uncharacterized RDD family membrane protein YckC